MDPQQNQRVGYTNPGGQEISNPCWHHPYVMCGTLAYRSADRCVECCRYNIIPSWRQSAMKRDRKTGRLAKSVDPLICQSVLKHFLDTQPLCAYCAVQMHYVNDPNCMERATLDRIDSSLAHTAENCVLACRRCNITKGARKWTLFGFEEMDE